MKNDPEIKETVGFVFPIDGDCLNEYDGALHPDGSLTITATVQAPQTADLWINGVKAHPSAFFFAAEVTLTDRQAILLAEDKTTGTSTAITVYRLKNSTGKYRLSVDDNILFLKDITDHQDSYRSIFENPYLFIFKKAHDLYGAVVHFNIYWEFNEQSARDFSEHQEYFNLSLMTDRFKEEFIANSDWLRLSFHAKANYPDKPYEFASASEVSADIERVHREIIRFAGKETLSPVTTLHWGAANLDVVRALRQHGYKGLTGYFEVGSDNATIVAYHYPEELVRHIGDRDYWHDTEEDIAFGRIDIVLNCYHKDTVVSALQEVARDVHRFGFLSMLIHEEYFYSDYCNYFPDFEEIVLKACKYAHDTGHIGSTQADVMFGE